MSALTVYTGAWFLLILHCKSSIIFNMYNAIYILIIILATVIVILPRGLYK